MYMQLKCDSNTVVGLRPMHVLHTAKGCLHTSRSSSERARLRRLDRPKLRLVEERWERGGKPMVRPRNRPPWDSDNKNVFRSPTDDSSLTKSSDESNTYTYGISHPKFSFGERNNNDAALPVKIPQVNRSMSIFQRLTELPSVEVRVLKTSLSENDYLQKITGSQTPLAQS